MKRVFGMVCVGAIAACLVVGCAKGGGKTAADEGPKGEITAKTAKRLQEVGALMQKKDYPDALEEIDDLAASDNLNPYERAKVFQMRAGILFLMDNLADVPADLQKALDQDALSKAERVEVTYMLGQALYGNERFDEAADAFEKWSAEVEEPKPEQQYVAASAMASAKRFDKALPLAKKAVEANEQPPESWLLLVASIQYELKQNEHLAETLTQLTKRYPKKEHYLQLSALYTDMDDSVKALKALEAADAKGMLSEDKEYRAIAQLYLEVGQAKKGAAILDKQMKAGKVERSTETLGLLAILFIGAKEADRASAILEEAGDAIDAGQPFLDLARLQGERGEWEKARDAAAQAVVKGGIETPGEAHLVLGAAHHMTKRKDAATNSLTEAKKHPAVAPCANEMLRVVKAGKGEPPACALKPVGKKG
jgi:tetratricopeptide (TPR) repeat protein